MERRLAGSRHAPPALVSGPACHDGGWRRMRLRGARERQRRRRHRRRHPRQTRWLVPQRRPAAGAARTSVSQRPTFVRAAFRRLHRVVHARVRAHLAAGDSSCSTVSVRAAQESGPRRAATVRRRACPFFFFF